MSHPPMLQPPLAGVAAGAGAALLGAGQALRGSQQLLLENGGLSSVQVSQGRMAGVTL